MLEHVSIAVRDLERSLAFYQAALRPLGIKRLMAYGGESGSPQLLKAAFNQLRTLATGLIIGQVLMLPKPQKLLVPLTGRRS